mgnify:CR=1 FL=1
MPDHSAVLTSEQVAEFGDEASRNSSLQLMQNIVTQRDVNEVALNHKIISDATHNFSNVLDDWSVTNQARSGRCCRAVSARSSAGCARPSSSTARARSGRAAIGCAKGGWIKGMMTYA